MESLSPTVSPSGPHATRRCANSSETTAAPCSPCCDLFTVLKLAYRVIVFAAVVSFMVHGMPLAATLGVFYGASGCAERTSAGEIARAVLATAVAASAAGPRDLSFYVWLAFMAAVVHIMHATVLTEMDRFSDCANCCNEGYRCKCGREKMPITQGSLERLSTLVGRRWKARCASRAILKVELSSL